MDFLDRLKKYARISLWDMVNRSEGDTKWISMAHIEKLSVDSISVLEVSDLITLGIETELIDNRVYKENELGPLVNKVFVNLKSGISSYLKREFYLYLEGVQSLDEMGRD